MRCIYITGALRITLTKALYAMLNWHPTEILAKQVAKFSATRLNALSCWHIVTFGHSTILEVEPVAPVIIDYLPAEYCVDRGFHFLIPTRDDWDPNTVFHLEHQHIYTNGSKLDSLVGSGIYSGKLDPSFSLRLPNYCSMFQAEVMAIYRAAQLILVNVTLFTCVSIYF